MRNIFFFIAFTVFFTGCYEQKLTISNDFRGNMTYNITLNKNFYNFINNINTFETSVAFDYNSVISKSYIQDNLSSESGVFLIRHSVKKDGDSNIYSSRFNFEEIEKMPDFLPSKYFKTYIFKEGKNNIIRTSLNLDFLGDSNEIRSNYRKLGVDKKKYIDIYAEKLKLKFVYALYTPFKKIDSLNDPKVSKDKKTLLFEVSLYDLLNSKSNLEIIITL